MTKAINIKEAWPIVAAGAAVLLCIHRKKGKVSGIGAVSKQGYEYRKKFAERYFENHKYPLPSIPIEEFIDEYANKRVKAMANGVIKYKDKKYKAPYTNSVLRDMDTKLAIEFYQIEFTEPKVEKQGFFRPTHETKYYRGLDVTKTPHINFELSGVGDSINPTTINKARELFENFDEACEIEREHSEKVDVVFEELEGRGIDWQSEDGQKIANEALFRAGLSDPDGNTDVYVNRINARKELLNFLQQVIVPLLPICDNDKELLMNISSITKQNDFIDLMRGYLM